MPVDYEVFLEQLNSALVPAFGVDALPDLSQSFRTGHIVGLPRSGTTLTSQLLAMSGGIGYPGNVMAPFWRVPVVGARLQAKLAEGGGNISLESSYGRTGEPLDPHEFGYFWRSALGHSRHTVEPDGPQMKPQLLQRTLDSIADAFGKPTVYKNFYAARHAEWLRQNLHGQVFVVTQRPALHVAASLLVGRRSRGLAVGQWLGAHPQAMLAEASEAQAIALQLQEIGRWLPTLWSAPDSIVITYDVLCADPRSTTRRILELLDASPPNGWQDRVPAHLEPGVAVSTLSRTELDELRAALREVGVDLE